MQDKSPQRGAGIMLRQATIADSETIARIYNHYILNTTITFEEQEVSAHQISARISDVAAASLPWLVAEESDKVIGYAYATKWRARSAYRFSVESTIYLEQNSIGLGLGSRLYRSLIDELKKRKIHAVMGGIALPNPNSIALHEKLGFNKVAQFKDVGYKFNKWIDVGYWQLVL
jgi:L-amino acid N-acyltransferase YncA